jgi:hypothetical protein
MEDHFMSDSLQDLESRRADLVTQIAGLGDLRSGFISDTSGRCGKPNCRCHKPGNPVHGPNPRLTYKGQRQDLPRSISGGRAGVPGKKTAAAACEKASSQLGQQLQRIFADRHKTGQLDLEAAEMAIRSTVHQTGADAITQLLRLSPPDDDHRSIPCPCGRIARYEEMRSRPILTVVGWARIDRPYYLCPVCHTGQFPADVELDIDQTDFSPGVRRMLATVGGVAPFAQGRDQMKLLAGLEVTAERSREPPNRLDKILRSGSRKISRVPSNSVSRPLLARRFHTSMFRWMERRCLW